MFPYFTRRARGPWSALQFSEELFDGTEGQDQKCCVPCEDLLTPRFSFAGWIQEWARGRNAMYRRPGQKPPTFGIGESNQRDVRVRGLRDGCMNFCSRPAVQTDLRLHCARQKMLCQKEEIGFSSCSSLLGRRLRSLKIILLQSTVVRSSLHSGVHVYR